MSADVDAAPRLPVATGRQSLREVIRHLGRRRRWWAALIALVLVAGATVDLVTPLTLGAIVESVRTGEATTGRIWGYAGTIAAAGLVAALLSALGLVWAARLFESMLASIRERLVHRAFALPQQVVERSGTGDLISRASDDVAQVSEAVPQMVPAVCGSMFTIVVTFFGMAVLDYRYALALALILPIHVLTLRWYLRAAPPIYAAERAAMATRAGHMLASLNGMPTVQAYRLADAHSAKMSRASWAVVTWSMKARIVQNMFFGRLNLAEWVGMSAILVVGFVLIDAGASTVGAATTAMLFFLRLFGPINQLLFVIDSLQSAAASLNRIVGVLVFADEHATAPAEAGRATAEGPLLRVDGVDFAYDDGHPVLHGVDLHIGDGEHVALVGASGAGKTTLGALIAGVHRPSNGVVVHREPDSVLLVTQETHVFAGTLRDNLTLARPTASDGHLHDALAAVGADVLVAGLPDGLDTRVGEGGHRLSTSAAQHLALARIVLADPRLAILDEASAEAGSANSDALDRASAAALAGRGALVIAHRLSQAAAADRILVMERGRIVERGTHADLLARGERYATMWAAWSSRTPADVSIDASVAHAAVTSAPRPID